MRDIRTNCFPMGPQDLFFSLVTFGCRERDRRIQVTGHSDSGNLNNFGSSSLLMRMLTQRRLLHLCILEVAKLHLILLAVMFDAENLVQ